jgi:phosphomannomutase
MKNPATKRIKQKDLIVFDLDGTLTQTKSNLETPVRNALIDLLKEKKVAVIGGGRYKQFQRQFIRLFKCPPRLLPHLFIFPTTATSFYRYQNGWNKVYSFTLSKKDKDLIKKAFKETLEEINYIRPKRVYGKVLEDRGSQFTFSALGQDVVAKLGKAGVRLKEEWTRRNTPLKLKIAKMVQKRLPHLEVRASGFTSIDVTKKGIDKEYGIKQIKKHLHIPISKMLFVGDAIFPGGNDYAIVKTGIDYIKVNGPKDTEKIIRRILSK